MYVHTMYYLISTVVDGKDLLACDANGTVLPYSIVHCDVCTYALTV